MALRNVLVLGLMLCLTACSATEDEPIVYSYPRHQLPNEPRYGTTAWVQPPTVVPNDSDQSGFASGSAPLLKPSDSPVVTHPKLPSAASSRRY